MSDILKLPRGHKKLVFEKKGTEITEVEPVNPNANGQMVFAHINGKWKQPHLMVKRAEEDNKRIEIEQAAKDRL